MGSFVCFLDQNIEAFCSLWKCFIPPIPSVLSLMVGKTRHLPLTPSIPISYDFPAAFYYFYFNYLSAYLFSLIPI